MMVGSGSPDLQGLNELGYYETQTLLMAAAKSHQAVVEIK